MKHWLFIWLFSICPLTQVAAAQNSCDHLKVVLAPELSPNIVEREWASGESSSQTLAVLELRGCKDQLLDHLTLDAPLAKLDSTQLRGTSVPTYLVTVDLTATAGSYNGPLTLPVQIVNHHLQLAVAITPDGHIEPIHLAMTGKAAWKKFSIKGIDNLLSISSQPQNNSFITFYRRYHPTHNGWQVYVRTYPELWESDVEFPETKRFP